MAELTEDTRQQCDARGDKHAQKHKWWGAHGVTVVRRKLDCGDYMTDGSNITIDSKKGLDELAQNINGRNHDRFKRECVRAREAGLLLVVLVECAGYERLEDVAKWTNTHCVKCGTRRSAGCNPRDARGKCPRHGTRKPIQGPRLYKAMQTMSERYGVEFAFAKPNDSARYICERLGVGYE